MGGKGRYADANGIKLYYEVHGSGRPLLLLHGGLGMIEMFGPNLESFAKVRQVVAPDLQGHGRTADIDRPITSEAMADDAAALIRHLKLGRPDVLGYSMGGGAALQLALRHPDLVNKLVIVSTNIRRSAFYPDILVQQAQVNAAAAEMMKGMPLYRDYAAVAPRPQDWPRLLDKMGAWMKIDFDLSPRIKDIQSPTMVVAGDADIFPPRHAIEFFELLGGGQRDGGWDGSGVTKHRLAILPGVTHYAMGASPKLAEAVIPFLEESA